MLLMMLKLSEYSEALLKLDKERYSKNLWKLNIMFILMYIDDSYNCGSVPVVTTQISMIFCYVVVMIPHVMANQQMQSKSLDNFRMVCAEGWMSTLQTKTWVDAVVIKGEIEPSRQRGVLYKTW